MFLSKLGIILFLFSSFFLESFSFRQLTAKYLDVKLPSTNHALSAIYDGVDSIYFFGGTREATILKFSISNENLEIIGKLPLDNRGWATVQSDRFGNIFYFGGGFHWDEIYKFNTNTLNITTMATELPYRMYGHTSFKSHPDNDIVHIMGRGKKGQDDEQVDNKELWSFNLETEEIDHVANLRFSSYRAASVPFGNKVFVFGRAEEMANRFALQLSMDTFQMERVGPDTLPIYENLPSAVTDGSDYIYILGGHKSIGDIRTDGLYQFNAHTFENHFIPVANLPSRGDIWFSNVPRCAFVGKLNRIYCFGGETRVEAVGSYTSYDGIFYIDLTPVETPTTMPASPPPDPTTTRIEKTTISNDPISCRGRPDGIHSLSNDSSHFTHCHQGRKVDLVQCSPGYAFDLVNYICENTGKGLISTSSVNRLDGSFALVGLIITYFCIGN